MPYILPSFVFQEILGHSVDIFVVFLIVIFIDGKGGVLGET